ncbi:MAG: tRNA lysidine(34) synthetase TilS [Duncaniella sp.]|nr:tRNA lysidine(34) synthetase TilS [Duncaniella sp.]
MTDFEHKVLEAALSDCGLERGSRVMVGLSGGADSVALLLALLRADYDVVASHCNFHLRGEESDRDMRYCEDLCRRLGVTLSVKHFDVGTRREATGESVEMACRSLRYGWWKQLLGETGAEAVAVGHHFEDNVETFFLNLLRGSGIAGLKGMLPRNGRVVRPMLRVKRQEIEAYLAQRGETWVEDSTNNESDYRRNRIRNDLLPFMENLFPGAMEAVGSSVGHLRDNYLLYRHSCSRLPGLPLDVGRLISEYSDAAPVGLFEALRPLGFNRTQTSAILRSTISEGDAQASGRGFVTPEGEFRLHQGVIDRASAGSEQVEEQTVADPRLLKGFSVTTITAEEFRSTPPRRDTLYVDPDAIPHDALWTLRSWREGDRLAPFGMKGSRPVSYIFSDLKLSPEQRRRVPLLFVGGRLVWLVGIRTSRHYAVTASTRRVACITELK